MKVAVAGCGAVGSFYGGKLARDGHEVHFLLRSDYERVRRNGVLIRSPQGDFRIRPKCARAPGEIGPADLVLVGLKTTANDQLPVLVPPMVGPHTAVLTLQNGLGNEEALARLFPVEQILGGLCFVCLNRVEPGLIHHIDHGLMVLGEFQRWPEPRTHEVAAAFRHAGVPCSVTDNLARAHYEKLTWNIPFNGLGVAGAAGLDAVLDGELKPGVRLGPCLTTDKLLDSVQWRSLVRELMLEVIAVSKALGHEVDEAIVGQQFERTSTMGPYKASTLLDFEKNRPLELDSLFFEPRRQAKQAGVPVPRLENLCRILEQLDKIPRSTTPVRDTAVPERDGS
jgi:2-dehydropantoate 2-reductase